jgi:hypothetical protein
MLSECTSDTLSSFEHSGAAMTQERMETEESLHYVAYLLRMWGEKSGRTTEWRASLQDPHSGDRVGFADLDELFGFLRWQTGAGADFDRE